MSKLPRANGEKHVAAFKRAGWKLNHIEGSHYILIKEGSDVHLSIPVHKNKTLGPGLLKKLILRAGLTTEEYVALFYKRKVTT
jgi:predicted RNA binding protein YcfA (HicA-like mRNA interferase family)